jgi:hypothetical protein
MNMQTTRQPSLVSSAVPCGKKGALGTVRTGFLISFWKVERFF